MWLVTEDTSMPMGTVSDSSYFDKSTLRLTKRVVHQGPVVIDLQFADNKATGTMTMNGQERPINADLGGALFADGAGASDVIGSLPLAEGYTTMIETSGERFVGTLPREVIKIVDVKCPDSGEADTFDFANLEAMDEKDEIKFVISTRRDYEFARDFTREHGLVERVREVLLSPVFPDPAGKWTGLEARELAEWILADGLRVRLGLQLHKFIWDPAMKGV